MICKSTNKNIDLSFHVFPKSEKRKNEWTESVRKVRGKDFFPKLYSYVFRKGYCVGGFVNLEVRSLVHTVRRFLLFL